MSFAKVPVSETIICNFRTWVFYISWLNYSYAKNTRATSIRLIPICENNSACDAIIVSYVQATLITWNPIVFKYPFAWLVWWNRFCEWDAYFAYKYFGKVTARRFFICEKHMHAWSAMSICTWFLICEINALYKTFNFSKGVVEPICILKLHTVKITHQSPLSINQPLTYSTWLSVYCLS